MQQTVDDLREIPDFCGGQKRIDIERLLAKESALFFEQKRLIETFKSVKSVNVVLKNSLSYFPILVAENLRYAQRTKDDNFRRDHAMKGDMERCLLSGMDGYLSKPIQPAELAATVHRVIALNGRS
jgi:hypothetical protein